MSGAWESDTYREGADDALDATPSMPDSGTLYAPEARQLARDAMIADTVRRVREVLADQRAAMSGGNVEPPQWAFALAPGEVGVCGACGAWGAALELGAGPDDPDSSRCRHAREYRTTRQAWLLVTLGGSVVLLSDQLLAALRPTWERHGAVLWAQGQVPAALEPGYGQPVDEPIQRIVETLVLSPSRRALRRAASERVSTLDPRDARYPLVYTTPARPAGWPR